MKIQATSPCTPHLNISHCVRHEYVQALELVGDALKRYEKANLADYRSPSRGRSAACDDKARYTNTAPKGAFKPTSPYAQLPATTFRRVAETADRMPWYQTIGNTWRLAGHIPPPPIPANDEDAMSPATQPPPPSPPLVVNDLLPCLLEAEAVIQEEDPSRGIAWTLPSPPTDGEGPLDQVETVLHYLGECLYRAAQSRWNPSTQKLVRMEPLDAMLQPLTSSCMYLDPTRVARSKYVSMSSVGKRYARVELVKKRSFWQEEGSDDDGDGLTGSPIRIGAHRFTCWAFHGPPPGDPKDWVTMHACNHPTCIIRDHLSWGRYVDNLPV